jgi:Family of unknown function (DUF6519)/Right handed beta helix region
MSGDYSRNGFDPWLDDLGVLLQQGRPLTDRDWNDLVLQLSRRIQAGTLDTVGAAAVPAQTPDAFKVDAGGGSLTIGRGRMYVDGLLAENHGAPPPKKSLDWDQRLAEKIGSDALVYAEKTDYTAQPYYPNPPNLPSSSGKHLVYLDVWQREVTHPMRPEMVEPALGVDTTARLQTVWQVKVLSESGTDAGSDASCATPLDKFKGWLPLNAPSAGLLTAITAKVPGQPDPCQVPPAGGYKGAENQLYRVEIHQGGAPGKATFKWSRDNASIETAVTAIPTLTQLVVESVGKDTVLCFSNGDWIEITDDWLELHNQPGLLRRIKTGDGVDLATRTITLEQQLPANQFPTDTQKLTDPLRHTRIRRWDQKGKVLDAEGKEINDPNAADGHITVPAGSTQILLEHGIVVSFSVRPIGGEFRSGEFWVFTARAGDNTIEELDEAPPRGIHHHYAPLGLWDAASGKVTDDCRTHWPPACGGCCTITVAPGESIQAALDSLPKEGGCVCLKTGVHEVSAAIKIRSSRITLRGEGPGVIVRSAKSTTLVIVPTETPVSDVAVESIRFEANGVAEEETDSILYAAYCSRLRVEHCEMAATSMKPGKPVGAFLFDVVGVSFTRNRLLSLDYGLAIADCAEQVEVGHNHIEGVTGGSLGAGSSGGSIGVLVKDGDNGACHIHDNVIAQFVTGIRVEVDADNTVVANNRISRSAAAMEEEIPVGSEALRKYLDNRLYAINIKSPNCEVRGNYIDLPSPVFGGIRASAAHVKVMDNILEARPGEKESEAGLAPVPASIYCLAQAKEGRAANHAVLRNNQLLGPQTGIVVSRVDGVTVAGNHVDGDDSGWHGVLIDDCSDSCVQDNDIQGVVFGVHLSEGERNRLLRNQVRKSLVGISTLLEADLELSGNTLLDCVAGGIVLLWVVRATAVLHNRIMNCAYAGVLPFSMLVLGQELLLPSGGILRVEDCEVIDTGISPDGKYVSSVAVAGIGAWVPACQITGNRVGYTQEDKLKLDQHRALLLTGPIVFSVGHEQFTFGSALVSGNHFRGPGRSTLVELLTLAFAATTDFRFEKVTFTNNICEHLSAEPNKQTATIHLSGGKLIAMGNHVKAAADVNAMSLANGKKNVLVGNVTTGKYINPGTVTPSPITNFNVQG